MILASVIANLARAALDAEGSDYYRDDLDIIPAINYSIERLCSIVEAAFGAKKISDEIFSDLSRTDVYEPSQFSRVSIDTDAIWTILAVYVDVTTYPVGSFLPYFGTHFSAKRSDLSFIKADNQCSRLTFEEWTKVKKNPFRAGTENTIHEGVKDYGYLSISDYSGGSGYTAIKEIEISPYVTDKFVAISIAKTPTLISSLSDHVQFPVKATNILLNLCLEYISRKQGDQTTIKGVSSEDVENLAKSFK